MDQRLETLAVVMAARWLASATASSTATLTSNSGGRALRRLQLLPIALIGGPGRKQAQWFAQ